MQVHSYNTASQTTTATAATLSGRLLAVGGDEENGPVQSSVYMFVPPINSWVKLPSGDLPVERYSTTNVQLSNNRVMVMGGLDKDDKDTSTCYIGSILIANGVSGRVFHDVVPQCHDYVHSTNECCHVNTER